jgi:hypothetical protein
MRRIVHDIQEQENPDPLEDFQVSIMCVEKKLMHPDDFEAHLAWVTAKRVHELVSEKPLHKSRFVIG